MDCSSCVNLISKYHDLPEEILHIIDHYFDGSQYLEAIAELALDSKWTTIIFATHEPFFVDICSKWLSKCGSVEVSLRIVSALARVIPLASYLCIYAEQVVCRQQSRISRILSSNDGLLRLPDDVLNEFLLTLSRLLAFDHRVFGPSIFPGQLQRLLSHSLASVRYLATSLLCTYLFSPDSTFIEMTKRYAGHGELPGDWEGQTIDYMFFSLWEQQRLQDSKKLLRDCRAAKCTIAKDHTRRRMISIETFSDTTAYIAGVQLPRLGGEPSRSSSIVLTPKTSYNMRLVAEAIREPKPLLITGLSGSGKSAIIQDIARELNKDSKMLTLHLNEQTDAKLLIGMYTSTKTPGSFGWQPGVLTTAVKEGRWVLIEDLDRAPAEVISILLPLLEREEMYLQNSGKSIHASPGFKLISTIRTNLKTSGRENMPGKNILGLRHWEHVSLLPLSEDDLQSIILHKFPILHKYMPRILSLYTNLSSLSNGCSGQEVTSLTSRRPIGPQDLLRWCARLASLLFRAGIKSGSESISDSVNDSIFLEAVDCFASGQFWNGDANANEQAVALIAEELQIPADRARYCRTIRVPDYASNDTRILIGRAVLKKSRSPQGGQSLTQRTGKRPFALTICSRRMLESVGVAVMMAEPCLLVGETGTGKTTIIQELANCTGHKLIVVNLSQQSEVGDLLGGYKPVNVRALAVPMKDEFDDLFKNTFSVKRNQRYLEILGRTVANGQWTRSLALWRQALRMINESLESATSQIFKDTEDHVSKRRKLESSKFNALRKRWDKFALDVENFQLHFEGSSKGFAFSFVEGNIIKAARNGDWVLLDEINLAPPDTLESLSDLLACNADQPRSLLLSETGEVEKQYAHEGFRVFGAMNPATDVGKKDLSASLRSRFTEYFIDAPDKDEDSLKQVINVYLGSHIHTDVRAASDIARLYLQIKRLQGENLLVDGANQRPHFSLRTLTRTLTYATDITPSYGLRRALFEGFSMSFLTVLNHESRLLLLPLIEKYLLRSRRNRRSLLSQTPKYPNDGESYIQFRHYWIAQGLLPIDEQRQYIITPFVERNLLNLVRATSTRRFPVLLQGPTSSGKTSMIEYLAKISGNKFVRVNNHEHTDLQEYLGTYVSGQNGQLHYEEGILVHALRNGYWIVLDELNLAPTDVLEALNRLLDDNRELLIPETQEIVRPHEKFMLFATQNPPGLYGGRKVLSRAFRNRFLELHFDDIPEDELEIILRERSQTAPQFCTKIITVYKKLSILRQSSRLFEQKHSYATLRDMFRWALRGANDNRQLAVNGFFLLAERVRNSEERLAVKQVIEDTLKVKLDDVELYAPTNSEFFEIPGNVSFSSDIVWTKSMRRLFTLVVQALKNNEPILLVGETGCGKTTICQVVAEAKKTQLHVLNAHQNTETGDIIGTQRPVRNRAVTEAQLTKDLMTALKSSTGYEPARGYDLQVLLDTYKTLGSAEIAKCPDNLRERIELGRAKISTLFEWSDGSLVQAMKHGHYYLLDEISLADDSVLERLNSVLEPGRTLLLAEKGLNDPFVTASNGFQFLATMNPGGDYGKRELSPALRNRFTEIWVPTFSDEEEILEIATARLVPTLVKFARPMVDFAAWYHSRYTTTASSISLRGVLAWVDFVNSTSSSDTYFQLLHGVAMSYIDGLGVNPMASLALGQKSLMQERHACLEKLSELFHHDLLSIYTQALPLTIDSHKLKIGPFAIQKISKFPIETVAPVFSLQAPTTMANAMRVVRALQLPKPILLEGSPGVGKTTLIQALAHAVGMPLTRINLSEQTDIMDLFGSDIPVQGGDVGHFAWQDAPFLQAMQEGGWVLLDEMNLASQSVLEGLNACLDHRGQIYVPELDQTFSKHLDFAVFAAQNPHHQGGGRKGLPASFINRFTVVYADEFTPEDLLIICKQSYSDLALGVTDKLINYVTSLSRTIQQDVSVPTHGGPWEFNLRDVLRWLHLVTSPDLLMPLGIPAHFEDLLFLQRFRDRETSIKLSEALSSISLPDNKPHGYFYNLSPHSYQVGHGMVLRSVHSQPTRQVYPATLAPDLPILESVMICIQHNWPCLLVGPAGSGKSSAIRHLASIAGADLIEFALNPDMDTMDLIGGYEQFDPQRHFSSFISKLQEVLRRKILSCLPDALIPEQLAHLFHKLDGATTSDIQMLHESICTLTGSFNFPELSALAMECRGIVQEVMLDQQARFEWVDGILVKALQKGQWLILDNANLCSSSVLDRLNSLLEPNGCLNVNEHRCPDGSARKIVPHPDFRFFLTMNPQYGELSRAMRNRCVELFLFPKPVSENNYAWHSQCGSSLSRFALFHHFDWSTFNAHSFHQLATLCFDHLSFSDYELCERWHKQVLVGLASVPVTWRMLFSSILRTYCRLADKKGVVAPSVIKLYQNLTRDLSVPQEFHDVQPIHPLNNTTLLPGITGSRDATVIGSFLESLAQLYQLEDQLALLFTSLDLKHPSNLSKLERSMASGRTLTFSNDSTQPLANFLDSAIHFICQFIETQALPQYTDKVISDALQRIIAYIVDVFDYTLLNTFDEGIFQIYLVIGRSMITSASTLRGLQDFCHVLSTKLDVFNPSWKLLTGYCMEELWKIFRPPTAKNMQHLELIQHIENLAERFDALTWKLNVPFDELINLRGSLASAYERREPTHFLHSGEFEAIQNTFESLEARLCLVSKLVVPYFRDEFEGIAQHLAAANSKISPILDLLAGHETKVTLQLDEPSYGFGLLTRHERSTGIPRPETAFMAVKNLLPISIIKKMHHIVDVPLKSLELLSREVKELAKGTAAISMSMLGDPYRQLNSILLFLHAQVCEVLKSYFDRHSIEAYLIYLDKLHSNWHDDSCQPPEILLKTDQRSDIKGQLRSVFEIYLSPSLLYLCEATRDGADQIGTTAKAWIKFFTGCLVLFVPDRPFDPALMPKVEEYRYHKRKTEMQEKVRILHQFERRFTGQNSSFRSYVAQLDLQALGDQPDVPAIARPVNSELGLLQGELNNVLNSIIRHSSDNLIQGDATNIQEVQIIRHNISNAVSRLSTRFEAYRDITKPIIQFLYGLDAGLALALIAINNNDAKEKDVAMVCKLTPFMGLQPWRLSRIGFEALQTDNGKHFDPRIRYLGAAALTRRLEGKFDLATQNTVFEIFASFFDDWKRRLASDRDKYASKLSLYRYQGGLEEIVDSDNQEFLELFPDYESTPLSGGTERHGAMEGPRSLAQCIANYHRLVLDGDRNLPQQILDMLREATLDMTTLWKDMPTLVRFPLPPSQTLPCSVLALSAAYEDILDPPSPGRLYNFYADSNLPEAQKLVNLAQRIENRFRDLQGAWPEHAMVINVLHTLEELMNFGHTQPVAKILTKVEQLYGYMHEWQVVASREYSVIILYDELTTLLVSWRRLELSTWARLLDIEDQRCKENAMSWWFIAFEVIIAVPVSSASSGEDISTHAEKLFFTLKDFLATTDMGQYCQRLRLIEQFEKHASLLLHKWSSMKVVHSALVNFIGFYTRFEPVINNVLTNVRQALEKEMNEILLLASWKDTNINALRESAKRSHHKLFKVIRKYRSQLAQPVNDILRQGVPQKFDLTTMTSSNGDGGLTLEVNKQALNLCREKVAGWSEKPAHFQDSVTSVYHMIRLSKLPKFVVDSQLYVNSFASNIMNTIKVLHRETPSILTKENTQIVKHLKSRKRKLFADTLKEMRRMGFKSNFDTHVLSRQASESVVLAHTPNFPKSYSEGHLQLTEFYFHKVLDNMGNIRAVLGHHSEDLSGRDAARCVGYLEGILFTLLEQRTNLSSNVVYFESLQCRVHEMKNLWAPEKYNLRKQDQQEQSMHVEIQRLIKWLIPIIDVGCTIIEKHNLMGEFESGTVIDDLQKRVIEFQGIIENYNTLPALPKKLSTSSHLHIHERSLKSLYQLSEDLQRHKRDHPTLGFVFDQIDLWTKPNLDFENSQVYGERDVGFADFDNCVSDILNTIFAAVKQIPKTFSSNPNSTEDAMWLTQIDSVLSRNLKDLRIEHIATLLEKLLSKIHSIVPRNQANLEIGAARCSIALPVIQKYLDISKAGIYRYAQLHESLCNMAYVLTNACKQVLSQGFCSPTEKSSSQEVESKKLEEGMGLGEGEGAENISKDIQDDEDLSELAQEGKGDKDREDVQNQEDAVDMQHDELRGDVEDASDRGEDDEAGSSKDDGASDMDEEAGDLNDSDNSIFGEKLLDGNGNEAEKDRQSDHSKGQKQNEQMAAQEKPNDNLEEEGSEAEEQGAEENEVVNGEGPGSNNSHLQDGENLQLPEKMDLDGDKNSTSDLDFDEDDDEISDVSTKEMDEEEFGVGSDDEKMRDVNFQQEMDQQSDLQDTEKAESVEGAEKTEDAGAPVDTESNEISEGDNQGLLQENMAKTAANVDDVYSNEEQGVGIGTEQHTDRIQEHNNLAQGNEGANGRSQNNDTAQAAADEGERGQATDESKAAHSQDRHITDSTHMQALKQLGNALERWRRQDQRIQDASSCEINDRSRTINDNEPDQDLEHLPDADIEADTQVLAAASEDQAHALDERALDSEMHEQPQDFQHDDTPEPKIEDENMEDHTSIFENIAESQVQSRPGAVAGSFTRNQQEINQSRPVVLDEDDSEAVANNISAMDLEPVNKRSPHSMKEARRLWNHYEGLTRDISLILTEQLRLILAPTLATKMRGDFRTGKRLNIKRIIPYIASQYKRDKIWMRRSIPSKRNYQIMLAIDDSKSMSENGTGQLAFETVALVSKSLSMLEVGEICIIGFGDHVHVAHEFGQSFSSEVGANVFQQFTFKQETTNVQKLIAESIFLFRQARNKTFNAGTDLWQLELIISDGVCNDHSTIQRLVRQAQDERIMIVFIVVDSIQGKSILDMSTATFEPGEGPEIKRYLDSFPFGYYLIVRDVRELPSVLSTALRQWFAEVVECA